MAGILERAKRLFSRGPDTPKAEVFSIRCHCGERREGLRTAEFQVPTCEACGASLFVLPIFSLPAPGPQRKSKLPANNSLVTTKEPARDHEPAIASPANDFSLDDGPADPKSKSGRPAILERRWQTQIEDEEDRPPPKPWITRRQLYGLAGVFAIGIFAFVLYRQQEIRELRDQLPERARRGLQLLHDGKFKEALEPLRLANRAVEWARLPFSGATEVRQAYKETAAVNDLLDIPLEAAVENCGGEPAKFASLYAGKSVLLDLEVEALKEGGYQLPIAVPIGDRLVSGAPQPMRIFVDAGISEKRRVLVAVRLESMAVGKTGDLTIRFQPESGVWITEIPLVEMMGLAGDKTAEEIRRQQLEMVLEKK